VSPGTTAELLERARRWRDADPDPHTRAAMDQVIDRGDAAELGALVGTGLRFGTAGLRAPLGPGPNRMNRLVVRHASTALAEHLLDGSHDRLLVVVGHDARHGSAQFARDATEVLTEHGIDVARFDGPVPTPLVAGAVRELGAVAAVVVTASHNPASDNGLKVYAADGAQIVPPADLDLARRMAQLTHGEHRPRTEPLPSAGRTVDLGSPATGGEVVRSYLHRARSIAEGRPPRRLRVAHTSLHGVGNQLLSLALAELAGVDATGVATQCEPDPDFPTVASPNPEEPGALDHLLALAAEIGADVALALDPDADRLAVALPRRSDGTTTWQQLSGDEVGALLAADLLDATAGVAAPADRLLVTTVVSSRLVPTMGRAAGVHHAVTLTGFKWLCRPAIAHPEQRQLLAYEEALGYAVGPDARDKDGITAAIAVLCAIGGWRAQGRSPWDVLDELARRHGAHVTSNGSIPLSSGLDPAGRSLDLAARPSIGGVQVAAVDHPAPDITRMELADRTRVIVRPSGTEPKLKYYVEAIEPVPVDGDVRVARDTAGMRAERIVGELRTFLAD
jgi:phosphomannomutase